MSPLLAWIIGPDGSPGLMDRRDWSGLSGSSASSAEGEHVERFV